MTEQAPIESPTMLKLEEVAAELRVTTRSLKEQARRGAFPARRVSRKNWRVDRTEFEAWKAGTWAPASPPAPAHVPALPPPPKRRERRQRRKGA